MEVLLACKTEADFTNLLKHEEVSLSSMGISMTRDTLNALCVAWIGHIISASPLVMEYKEKINRIQKLLDAAQFFKAGN